MEDAEDDDYFDYMLASGVIEEHSIDDSGEVNYVYNFETMKRLHPDMYDTIMGEINESLKSLLVADMITVEYDEDLKAHIRATEKGISAFNNLMGEN